MDTEERAAIGAEGRKCSNCRFYFDPDEQCRRRPPLFDRGLAFHDSELLRDIAWSLRKISKSEGDPNVDDEVMEDGGESCQDNGRWPYAGGNDWCGEFQPGNPRRRS
jgi:hypothetical protein